MIADRRGQSALWGFFLILIILLITAAIVDVYDLFTTRDWAYSLAQEAALHGASRGRDWNSATQLAGSEASGIILNEETARSTAQNVVRQEMNMRGISGYTIDIRVLPGRSGGRIPGYPPKKVRLEGDGGDWSAPEPAVGVYLEVPVAPKFLNFFGVGIRKVYVFSAAGVHQP